jgi:uncharacterized protein (DUF362 family)
MERRNFLKYLGCGAVATGIGPARLFADPADTTKAVISRQHGSNALICRARGTDYAKMTHAVVDGLGGMRAFIPKGSRVIIKPNIGWDRPLSFRANTNPEIVRAAILMARDAEAADIRIVEFPVAGQNPANCFQVSGIAAVAQEAGIECYPVYKQEDFVKIDLPSATLLEKAHVIPEILAADVIINIPVAKSHHCTKFTGALKNWMGIISDRVFFHHNFATSPGNSPEHWRHIAHCIADIQYRIRPAITIMDATWIMTTNGPAGPGTLAEKNEILASTDPVAVDTYAVSLFDTIELGDVWSIEESAKLGLGEMDLSKITIKDVT